MYSKRISEFDIAMKLYRERKYKEAEKIFLELLKNNRRDNMPAKPKKYTPSRKGHTKYYP